MINYLNLREHTISNLELRIGILEDRLACEKYDTDQFPVVVQIEKLQKILKEERRSHYEALRLRGPG